MDRSWEALKPEWTVLLTRAIKLCSWFRDVRVHCNLQRTCPTVRDMCLCLATSGCRARNGPLCPTTADRGSKLDGRAP